MKISNGLQIRVKSSLANTKIYFYFDVFGKKKKGRKCVSIHLFLCAFSFLAEVKKQQQTSKEKQQNAMKEEENKSRRIFIFITYHTIYNT